MTDDDQAWFARKRYGYGTGLPVAWQGWALLGAYLVIVLLLRTSSERHRIARLALMLGTTVAFIVIAARHTRGGWRRR